VIRGSGIDVIEVDRIERALARFGARFERRVFSTGEIAACRRHPRPALQYALRFAAKEALMKAVGTGWSRGVRWIDIETVAKSRSREALCLALHGRVAEFAGRRGSYRTHLAVARSRRLALAAVLLEADPE
jgi:holo-[acyl-carrier protein] synthase